MAWNQVSVTHNGKDVIAWQREEIVNLPNILGDKPKTIVINNSKHNVISSWVDKRDDIIFLTVERFKILRAKQYLPILFGP